MRTIIVFDGDNYKMTAAEYYDNNERLGEVNVVNVIHHDYRNTPAIFIAAIFFQSGHRDAPAPPERYAINTSRRPGIEYRTYRTMRGQGYGVEDLLGYVYSHQNDFDQLILVTSDDLFFAPAEQLAVSGKRVVVLSLKRATKWVFAQRLAQATHLWLDDLIGL